MSTPKEKSTQALRWNIVDQTLSQGLNLSINIVLMWYLIDLDFGVVVVPMVVLGFFRVIQDLGYSNALIHHRDLDQSDLSSVFWFLIFLGFLFTAIMYLMAPVVSWWTENEYSGDAVRQLSPVIAVTSLYWISESLLIKRLQFKKIFMANLIAISVSGIIAIYLAAHGWAYHSLVIKALVHVVLVCAGYFILSGWWPSFKYDRGSVQKLGSYSFPLAIEQGLSELAKNFDSIIISRFLGSASVGLYDRAYKLVTYPVRQFSAGYNKVLFPILSDIQDERMRQSEIYLRLLEMVGFLVFPASISLFIFAEPLTFFILGSGWSGIIPMIKIFSILGLVMSMSAVGNSVFLATGETKLQMKITVFTRILLMVAILVSCLWFRKVEIVALVYTAVMCLSLFIEWNFLEKILHFNFEKIWNALKPSMMSSVLVAAIFYFTLKMWNEDVTRVVLLISLMLAYFVLYFVFLKLGNRIFFTQNVTLLKKFIQ
ncbi:MAG: lipopolysaccharide biosynthesis protein [Saprospiraceae bacterium]